MAFPAIQGADTKNGTVTSNSNSWTLTYPTNIAAGDLLLCFISVDGDADQNAGMTGWTKSMRLSATAVVGWVWSKIAAGTETGTFTVGWTASEQGSWRIFRITGWFGSGLAGYPGGGDANGNGISVSGGATGTDSAPNPPDLNPANWATEDTLWFGMCAIDTSRTISVYPLADNNTADVSGGAGGATLGLCTKNDAVGNLNPGTFTQSANDDWVALTVAVRPAAVAFNTQQRTQAFVKQALNRAANY